MRNRKSVEHPAQIYTLHYIIIYLRPLIVYEINKYNKYLYIAYSSSNSQ